MVIGTGMDLVDIERFRTFCQRRGQRGLARIFTPGELDYCLGLVDAVPSLAARFAAKEAFFKAIGIGWGTGGAWTEVEVVRDRRGAPALELAGRAAETARDRQAARSHLTLSHTDDVAGAVVVLEGPSGAA